MHPDESDLNVLIRTGFCDLVSIGLARTLLDDANIPYFEMDQNPAARQESGNFIGWWNIRVPRDREKDAREILENLSASS